MNEFKKEAELPEVNGNSKSPDPYHYHRVSGGCYGIYRNITPTESECIATTKLRDEQARNDAANIVIALNSRAKYLEKINFNKLNQPKK